MDSDNEKQIFYRTEREAEQLGKRKHPGGANAARKVFARDVVPVHPGTIGQQAPSGKTKIGRTLLQMC